MPGYERENGNVLRRCLKTASDSVELLRAMEGRCVLAPETGKARLPTVDRRTGSTARRWEATVVYQDMKGSQNSKSRSRDPSTTPFNLILHVFDNGPCSQSVREI